MKYDVSKKQLKEFGLLIGFTLPILFGLIFPSLGGHNFRAWTLWVGISFFILAIVKPKLLFYPYIAWMKLGNILGWINSHIMLGLVFFVVLQPIALIMKIFGHDPLRMKKNDQKSYRELKTYHKINLKRIF